MSLFNMNFPALVEHAGGRYRVSPLLFRGFSASHQRYGDALRLLQTNISNQHQHTTVDREQLESLLWYKFNPEYKFSVEHFSFRSGMHLVNGHFAVVQFAVQEHEYLCFPHLDYLLVRFPENVKKRPQKLRYSNEVLQSYFQKSKKQDEYFDSQAYYSSKNCSTINIEIPVHVKNPCFSFDQAEGSLWAFMQQDKEFDGARELNAVGEDFSRRVQQGFDNCLYRESEVAWLYRSLFSVKPQALVIIGPRGIGKSNIIADTYRRYLDDVKSKASHKKQKMWLVDPLRVISGMSIVGQWERRFEAILTQIRDRQKNKSDTHLSDLLYIDNPVPLLKIGKTSQTELTLAHMLIPYLEARQIPLILEATNEEWQKIQDGNRRFADLFRVLRLNHLEREKIDHILTLRKADFEKHFECEFSTAAFISLSKVEPALRGTRELPGSFVELMRSIAVVSQKTEIDDNRVYQCLQEGFNVSSTLMDGRKLLLKKDVIDYFRANLAGQDQACEILSDTVLSIKAQLCQSTKPQNTLLFIGPTGVGKTEAAKLLAKYLYIRQESLVRIDMNEFGDHTAVSRLIGDIYHPHGILTERVRYQRSCVLLLDEIEKAHPRVHDILLQLLDDGRLTDASGNTTDFSQCVVIMTSNVGAREAASHVGFVQHQSDLSASYKKSLETQFRPELLNRINNVVVFNALTQNDMSHLAHLHLKKVLSRDGFSRRNTILNVDKQCLQKLAEKSFDPLLGARALKRNLERFVTEATAHKLAELKAETPVIINMWEENNVLKCDAIELSYCEANAYQVPEKVQLDLQGYQTIHTQLQSVESALTESTSAKQGGGFLYWMLLDSLRNLKDPLRNFIFELEERAGKARLDTQYSYATKPPKYFESVRRPRVSFRDIHAQQDIQDYLSQLFDRSELCFSTDKTNQFQLWSDANRVIHTANSMLERGSDKLRVMIRSLISQKGETEVNYLLSCYRSRFEQFANIDVMQTDSEGVLIEAEGSGIKELFVGESGIHLFYDDQNTQVPIALKILDSDEVSASFNPQTILLDKPEILRIYTIKDGARHIADLRTGLLSHSNTCDHWWSFLAACLPAYLEVKHVS